MTARITALVSASAAILALGGLASLAPSAASAQFSIGVSVNLGPPPIPYFPQPPIPAYGYIWTPGYWAWDPAYGYYWVPGEWIRPPRIGFLWTPGYWAWRDNGYRFIGGYWGPTVGFYGGVNYGYGYGGYGYEGGGWRGDRFYYNRSVTNIANARIATVYNQPVRPFTASRVSYNGGRGGLTVRPRPNQLAAMRGPHIQPTATQVQRVHMAAANPQLRAPAVVSGRASAAVTQIHQRDRAQAITGNPGLRNGVAPRDQATGLATGRRQYRPATPNRTPAGGPLPGAGQGGAPRTADLGARNRSHAGPNPYERGAPRVPANPNARTNPYGAHLSYRGQQSYRGPQEGYRAPQQGYRQPQTYAPRSPAGGGGMPMGRTMGGGQPQYRPPSEPRQAAQPRPAAQPRQAPPPQDRRDRKDQGGPPGR
jgi:hypothetical protein